MYYVYLIRSIEFPNEKYIGFTDNFAERLKTHNSGKSPHTKLHKPWSIEVLIGFDDKLKAASFEKYLKSGSGSVRQKQTLVKYF